MLHEFCLLHLTRTLTRAFDRLSHDRWREFQSPTMHILPVCSFLIYSSNILTFAAFVIGEM